MYIIIWEDERIFKAETIDQDVLNAADDGLLQVVRVSDLKQYDSGNWVDIGQLD